MSTSLDLGTVLQAIESWESLAYGQITSELDKITDAEVPPGASTYADLMAERTAFRFAADSEFARDNWGTYYGPWSVMRVNDDKIRIYPHIDKISPEMVEYWRSRALACTNPVMAARYADLVWDLSKICTQKVPSADMARQTIDSTLKAVNGTRCKPFFTAWPLLSRALCLSLSLRDHARAKNVVEATIAYDRKTSTPGQKKAWCHSYDILITQKSLPLAPEQTQAIVAGLEESLSVAVTIPEGEDSPSDAIAAKDAVERLANYYRRTHRQTDLRRIMAVYGDAIILASRGALAFAGSAWLKEAYDLAVEFGIKNVAARLAVALREVGKKDTEKLQAFTVETNVDQTKLKAFIESLVEGTEDEAVERVIMHFIPRWNEARKLVLEIAKTCVFTSMVTQKIIDGSGREVASVGSVSEDMDGRVVMQMAQTMYMQGMFLGKTFQKLIEKFTITPDQLVERLLRCPAFVPEMRPAIARGIAAYFARDHAVVAHILVPQIEVVFRTFLAGGGVSVYRTKTNKHGGLDYRTLDEMIKDPLVASIFQEDVQRYFGVLLTDRRAWNLRNTVCHGLCNVGDYGQTQSDRILHVLLLLSLVQG